jgi:hypothetical protein
VTWNVAPLAAAPFGHDPERVPNLARDLLSESPFRDQQPSVIEQLVERIGVVLGELLGRLLVLISGDTAVAWVIVVLGSILLLAAVWRWTRGLRVAGGVGVELPDLQGLTADDWRLLSDEAVDRDELDRALRLRYLAVVAALVERGVLQDVPGRTIRELDAELAAMRPDLSEPVALAGARLERVTYGGVAATPQDIEVVDDALRALTATRVGSS